MCGAINKKACDKKVYIDFTIYAFYKIKVGLVGPSGKFDILDNEDGQELLDKVKKIEEF